MKAAEPIPEFVLSEARQEAMLLAHVVESLCVTTTQPNRITPPQKTTHAIASDRLIQLAVHHRLRSVPATNESNAIDLWFPA